MISFDEIKQEYEELVDLPHDADGDAKRKRGFAFERLLKKLFTHDNLEPRTGYRPIGEQIDGSIYLDGRIYLLEAKWHAEPLPASTLYQFKGKVDGKLAGTIGLFISMSGYADDAVDALILGKGLNVILFDHRDMDAAIIRGNCFKNILKMKLRKASEEGAIYFPAESEVVTAEEIRTIGIDHLSFDPMMGQVLATQPVQPAAADLLIVCEGETDRVVIATLVERILAKANSGRSVKIITAMGKLTIPRVANALWNTFQSVSKVLIVTDSDGDPDGTAAMLSHGLEFKEWVTSIPNPSIETWIELDREVVRRRSGRFRTEQYQLSASKVDIAALKRRDEEFRRFHDAVLEG